MNFFVLTNPETQLRLFTFLLILAVMLFWERAWPRRSSQRRALRWPGNFGVGALGALLLALLPVSAVAAALFADARGLGLLPWLAVPRAAGVALAILVLDFTVYWQHRAFHAWAWLWPLHRTHHTDVELDATTALRFHPLELALSMLLKAAVIVLLGAPPVAVVAFEIILNGAALFNHGNVRLPTLAERALRCFVVTPDMHRVHHSVHAREHNANFGFNLSLWDRLFASYQAAPREGHAHMQLGQPRYRDAREARLGKILTQPFR